MLFDWNAVAAPGQVQDVQPCAPLTLTGDGLWVCLVSSGRCTASVPSAGPLPAGEGEASVRLAVHLPLEIRQTHSPSPVRVRGSLGWISRTTPRAAVLVQS